MKYRLKNIKIISSFSILDIIRKDFEGKTGNISRIFWITIFNKGVLKNFIEKKYIFFKKKQLNDKTFKLFVKEYKFILSKLDETKQKINFTDNLKSPLAQDIFFSFRIFSKILNYYNEYYNDNIVIFLRNGLVFNEKLSNIDDFFNNIEYYFNTNFIIDIIKPLILKTLKIKSKEKYIYEFKIFWPEELITVGIISKLLKKIDGKNKIIVNFSKANEQFDFREWIKLIKLDRRFFNYFDYFIVYNDFGKGKNHIIKYENGNININILKNVIYYSNNKIKYNELKGAVLTDDMFKLFIEDTFNKNRISKFLGKKSFYARFLPYKCYWSNCHFCAINSQNKYIYDSKYSYDFFVNKWVDFIFKNKIFALNFQDEAIPPRVIILFAKKVIEKGLSLNYQFRTRFDKLYTYRNCKILYESGAKFCGIGLESAVDRVNEEIANKGNEGINIRDKIKIIHNFDKAGVSIHNYSIMGFPGETDKEAIITYKFLKENIINSNYYTCTPNIFGLMKGPRFFKDRKKYNIDIEEKDLNNPFKLIYEFTVDKKERNFKLLKKLEEDLHRTQFLPWLKKDNYSVNARLFWDYIDRSAIFYFMKRSYLKNPYHTYKNINNDILKKSYNFILDSNFKLSEYIQIFEYKNDKYMYIYNWIESKDTIVNKRYIKIIREYNFSLTLSENLKKLGIKNYEKMEKIIKLFIKDRVIISLF